MTTIKKTNAWNEFQKNCAKNSTMSTREFAEMYNSRMAILRRYLVSCKEPSKKIEELWELFEKAVSEKLKLDHPE